MPPKRIIPAPPGPPAKRGRPRKLFRRDDPEPPKAPSPRVKRPETPPNPTVADSDADASGNEVSPRRAAIFGHKDYQIAHVGTSPLPAARPRGRSKSAGRLCFRSVDHEGNGFTLETRKVLEVPEYFETVLQDYSVHEVEVAEGAAYIRWTTPECGDRPKDIRARRFNLEFQPTLSDYDRRALIEGNEVLLRARFNCLGACKRDLAGEAAKKGVPYVPKATQRITVMYNKAVGLGKSAIEWLKAGGPGGKSHRKGAEKGGKPVANPSRGFKSTSKSSQETSSQRSGVVTVVKRQRTTDATRDCSVKLIIEIRAGAMGTALFWHRGQHKDADPDALVWSHQLRRLAVEYIILHKATTAGVQIHLIDIFRNPNKYHVKIMEYRMPTPTEIENLRPAMLRRGRVAKNSFEALGLIASRNRDRVFLYQPHNPKASPPTELLCAGTDPYSLDNMLLHSAERGVGFDSSWRALNENCAPLTILTTVTDLSRMVPGGWLLSENVQSRTLIVFLLAYKKEMVLRGKEIHAGLERGDPTHVVFMGTRTDSEVEKFRGLAANIDKTGDWCPLFFMIDKSSAELKALQFVFPGVVIRICQFHVGQALTRADFFALTDDDDVPPTKQLKKGGKKVAPKQPLAIAVPPPVRKKIFYHFRKVQRFRGYEGESWEQYERAFGEGIEQVAREYSMSEAVVRRILQYFRDNWFCERWRNAVLDCGLPEGQTRDGPFSTNNYTESCIRTIKVVFLACRKNKRIDKLATILMDDFLPFYRFWPPSRKTADPAFLQVTRKGHDHWGNGRVVPESPDDPECRFYTVHASKRINGVDRVYEYLVDFDRPHCNCRLWEQTGKFCSHMWACQYQRTNGSPHEWDDQLRKDSGSAQGAADKFIQSRPSAPKGLEDQTDEDFERGLDMVIGVSGPTIEDLLANEQSDGPPDNVAEAVARGDSESAFEEQDDWLNDATQLDDLDDSEESAEGDLTCGDDRTSPIATASLMMNLENFPVDSPLTPKRLRMSHFIPPTDFALTNRGGRPANLTPLHRRRHNQKPSQFLPVYDLDSPRSTRKPRPSTILRSFRSPKSSGNLFQPPSSIPQTVYSRQNHEAMTSDQSLSPVEDLQTQSDYERYSEAESALELNSTRSEDPNEDPIVGLLQRMSDGAFSIWMKPGYQMYADELSYLSDMTNQMAMKVGSSSIFVPWYHLKERIDRMFPDLATKPFWQSWNNEVGKSHQQKLADFSKDQDSLYYLRLAYRLRAQVTSIYFLVHELLGEHSDEYVGSTAGHHWVIYEHCMDKPLIRRYDSLTGVNRTSNWNRYRHDMRLQHLYSSLLYSGDRAYRPSTSPNVEEVYLAKQVFDPDDPESEIGISACGHWMAMCCIVRVLGGTPECLPGDAKWLKESLIKFATEFHSGTLSQETVKACMNRRYKPGTLPKLVDAQLTQEQVWAVERIFTQPPPDPAESYSSPGEQHPPSELLTPTKSDYELRQPFSIDQVDPALLPESPSPAVIARSHSSLRLRSPWGDSSGVGESTTIWFDAKSNFSVSSPTPSHALIESVKSTGKPEAASPIRSTPSVIDLSSSPQALLNSHLTRFQVSLARPSSSDIGWATTLVERHRQALQSSKSPRPEDSTFLSLDRSPRYPIARITLRDYETLIKPRGYLNGTLIEAVITMFDRIAFPKVRTFNTFFATKLYREGFKGISSWKQCQFPKGKGVFSKECDTYTIMFPIHEPLSTTSSSSTSSGYVGHWTLCLINIKGQEVMYVNSLASEFNHFEDCKKVTIEYLAGRARIEGVPNPFEEDPDSWNFWQEECPQQSNGHDCGVFMLCNMLAEVLGSGERVTQDGIASARQALALHLCRGSLPYSHEMGSGDSSDVEVVEVAQPRRLTTINPEPPSTPASTPKNGTITFTPTLSPAHFSPESAVQSSSYTVQNERLPESYPRAPPISSNVATALTDPPQFFKKSSLKKTTFSSAMTGTSSKLRKSPSVTFNDIIDITEFEVPSSSTAEADPSFVDHSVAQDLVTDEAPAYRTRRSASR